MLSSDGLNSTKNQTNEHSNLIELENQFILRFPTKKEDNGSFQAHPTAKKLRELLSKQELTETTEDLLKDRLSIELNTETRKGRVKFDDEIFEARLVDLPCIIESLKTIDRKMFYKTADISQMLVCKTKDEHFTSSDEENKKKDSSTIKKKNSSDANNFSKKYQWSHGITAPLKNVRRKRFRTVAKKKIVDYADIEKEVKQLFRADREAVKVEYEVLVVEGELDENEDNKDKSGNDDDDDDSSQDEMGTGTNEDGKRGKSSSIKSKRIIEESNMSSAIDDEDSLATSTQVSKAKKISAMELDNESTEANTLMNPSLNYDEMSNDTTSNMEATNKSSKITSFKDLFVEQVIGDLSSSSDEDNDEGDEEDEEDEENNEEKLVSKKKVAERTKSELFGDESNLTFDDVGEESNMSNLDSKPKSALKDKEFDDDTNDEIKGDGQTSENLDILDSNAMESVDEISEKKMQNSENELNFASSLSSSPQSKNEQASDNKAELSSRLITLIDELDKIKEERRKREIEIEPINNPVLKAHLSSRLNNLIEEENRKSNEIEEIKSMINDQ